MLEAHELIHSPLCRTVVRDGHKVQVEIYSSGRNDWVLEVVDIYGNSTTWDDTFDTDEEAFAEFSRVIQEEGIAVMVGSPS